MRLYKFEELEPGKMYTDGQNRDLIFIKMRNHCLATFHLVDYSDDCFAYETDEEIYLTKWEMRFY